MRSTVASLVLLALAACSRHETAKQEPAPPLPWKDVALVHSTAITPPRTGAAIVLLDASGVRLAGDPQPIARLPSRDAWPQGFERSAKRSSTTDYYLVPLHDRVEAAFDGGAHRAALVAVAGEVPYRPVVEVLYTLGQAEIPDMAFVVASAGGAAEIALVVPHAGSKLKLPPAASGLLQALGSDGGKPIAPPSPAPTALKDAAELVLSVVISAGGMSVKAAGGSVAPGCKEHGPGVTIPKTSSGHDFAALTACASSLRALAPAFHDEHYVTVAADAAEPFASVVGAFDALRAAAFDRPSLGIAR